MKIAYFVSPHGFGHAARAAAVTDALAQQNEQTAVTFFTSVPEWFFEDSLLGQTGERSDPERGPRRFSYRELACDVGLVQKSALEVDLAASSVRLGDFFDEADLWLPPLAAELREGGFAVVVCDIAPIGLAAAALAELPCVLVENFTWDWIYEGYLSEAPELKPFAEEFSRLCASATQWIQVDPPCLRREEAALVPSVSRRPRSTRSGMRARLRLGLEPMVLLTMGGIPWHYDFLALLEEHPAFTFVVPGGSSRFEVRGNLRLMPHRSDFYHPDLVHAADVVVGKLGYSTVAEVTAACGRFLFVERPGFAESDILAAYVTERCPSRALSPEDFENGSWLELLPALLEQECPQRTTSEEPRGAEAVARLVLATACARSS